MNNKIDTIVLKTDELLSDDKTLAKAGNIIRNGGLVAFPTETVYGLGGNAFDKDAAKKIYAAKGRPSDNPLIVHIAEFESLYNIVTEVSEKAEILGEALWPGPLTMIFNKKTVVPDEITGGLNTVAVRLPSDNVARRLIKAAGGYIAAPSANVSGRPSATNAKHVIDDLSGRIDMIIDAGESLIGLESTIIDLTVEAPIILRPGYYSKEDIENLIGEVEIDKGIIKPDSGVIPKAPGMKYRHYAPKGEMVIVKGERETVAKKIRELVFTETNNGRKCAVMCTMENEALYKPFDTYVIGTASDELTIAHNLFDLLRKLDDAGCEYIVSEAFDTGGIGSAIMNRLLKAAGHKVINAND